MAFETNWSIGVGRRRLERQNDYNEIITRAVELYPEIDGLILKSLLMQESDFDPTVVNRFGYAGIAQIGREAAKDLGIRYPEDCCLPHVAIVKAAQYLTRVKAFLETHGMAGNRDWLRFALAAYNGGMGLIAKLAERSGRPSEITWTDCILPIEQPDQSLLWLTIHGMFPSWLPQKYHEISEYPNEIYWRAYQDRGLVAAQRKLADLKLYWGAIDGLLGNGSRQALAEYQRQNNLPVTYFLDEQTEANLLGLEIAY